MTPLVLASTSPYRRELLSRFGLAFEVRKPSFDEEAAQKEGPAAMKPQEWCQYLAREKARSLSTSANCVIGGDQMVVLDQKIFGKGGTAEKATAQLLEMQNRSHELLTAVSIFYRGQERTFLDVTKMQMRPLSTVEITDYLNLDQPLDCAGSYKIEKHGIALFEQIQSQDFTAIQGLPLIKLGQVLRQFGYIIPGRGNKEL